MRLLNVDTFTLEEFFYADPPPYAILSHTWGADHEEVSYRDVLDGRLKSATGRPAKVTGCCLRAKKDGYQYVWIDTCCIDKTNLVELQEAINSMFRWYRDAAICYAYLSDVPTRAWDRHKVSESAFSSSRWFQRGWTLQELLAPLNLRFYDAGWECIGTKGDLCDLVETITGIPTSFLLGITELHHASVAQRMSWASRRVTKRPEDIAYCLLGIFGVSMPMIYGEGDKAFRRLQEQIMKDIGDDSILAWDLGAEGPDPGDRSPVVFGTALAPAPSHFANSGRVVVVDHSADSSFEIQDAANAKQMILVRFRDTERKASDFVAVLQLDTEGRPYCCLMVASRETSLEEMAEHSMAWRDKLPGKFTANNVAMTLGIEVEALASPPASSSQRRFALKPTVIPGAPAVTVNVTTALQLSGASEILEDLCRRRNALKSGAQEDREIIRVTKEKLVNKQAELDALREKIKALQQEERRLAEELDQVDLSDKIAGMQRFIDVCNGAQVQGNEEAFSKTAEQALPFAIAKGYESLARLLLDRATNFTATDFAGRTALSHAVSRGHEEFVRLLIRKGADVSAPPVGGWTPLHVAADGGLEGLVGLLLEKGASLKAKRDGLTPEDLARRSGHGQLVKILSPWPEAPHRPVESWERPSSSRSGAPAPSLPPPSKTALLIDRLEKMFSGAEAT
ncbi:365ea253-c014-47d6-9621-6abcaff281c0 [Thermothielavioides terrestris]|uniref:365ea253-c014-47d6-9621-6abcaff281c0 n=1 Tax=Thermothielavioides terrestris TaxID=2587410 RepID=A0A446B6U9_9PEZI|nr:365ea253-c014-47d6-9621-6abcaff281c0 [Thermothielavioides terrestris]